MCRPQYSVDTLCGYNTGHRRRQQLHRGDKMCSSEVGVCVVWFGAQSTQAKVPWTAVVPDSLPIITSLSLTQNIPDSSSGGKNQWKLSFLSKEELSYVQRICQSQRSLGVPAQAPLHTDASWKQLRQVSCDVDYHTTASLKIQDSLWLYNLFRL